MPDRADSPSSRPKPKPKPKPSFSLKDQLFNRERVRYLAGLFQDADPEFDAKGFVGATMKGFGSLELKQRIARIADGLETHLADDFKVAAKQIVSALPPPLDPTLEDDDFGDFIFAPLGEYVVRRGIAKKHLTTSLRTIKAITQRFSMEDAIRAFINTHPDATLATLAKWSTDKNYHVRRLVSEGTRPRLPWSGRLSIEHSIPLPLLETLHADSTRYVTRSVSNHLNDIAKTDPGLVVQTLQRWKELGDQDTEELRWMSRHALRTLVKQGDPAALRHLGYRPHPKIKVSNFALTPGRVSPGQAIEFSFDVTAARDESLILDYVIDFVKAGGKRSSKVFKIKTTDVAKGETLTIRKRHPFRAAATTFSLYPGTHRVTLQVNGNALDTLSFEMDA